MYLLDTAVVFELGLARAGLTAPALAGWAVGRSPQTLFISAIALLELDDSAARLSRTDKAGALALRGWIDAQVMTAFDGRILAVDAAVVRRRGQLPYADERTGLLAATAIEHGLTLVTGNAAAFKGGRVKLINPWVQSSDENDDGAEWRQAARTGPLWLKSLFTRA